MANLRTLKTTAQNKKRGMTLAELSAFVIDAQHMGISGNEKVDVYIGFKANIQRLEVEGPAWNTGEE